MENEKKFSDRLKSVRKATGKTQKQVAVDLGIAERNYQRYEGRDDFPSLESAVKFADYFNVSIDYLVGRSSSPARLP